MANEDRFVWYDYLLFVGSLVISLGVGAYFSISGGKQRTNKEYLLANRELGVIPCCLSMLMSFMSAILVLGHAAEMYTHGIQAFMSAFGMALAFCLGPLLFIPLFYPLQLTSSFEYLEMRFKSRAVRLTGTVLSIINGCLYMGIAMYAPATAIDAVTPISWWVAVLGMGVVVTIYTTLGGMKAVVWTDVVQALFYFIGLFAVAILGVMKAGGFEHIWHTAGQGERLELDFSVNPIRRTTVWAAFVGTTVTSLAYAGTTQGAIQRYSSMKSLKSAMIASYLKAPLSMLIFVLVYVTGMSAYTYFTDTECDPLRSGSITNPNQVLPYFVVTALDAPGLPGLFVATLFSGALSSVSTSMNSNAAITWQDFLEPHFHNISELRKTTITKILCVMYGFIGVGLGFLYNYLPGHVMKISNTINTCASAPLFGLFVLGAWFPCANYKGALVGVAAGFILDFVVSLGNSLVSPWAVTLNTIVTNCTHNVTINDQMLESKPLSDYSPLFGMSFLWYSSLGSFTTIVVGIVVSYLTGATDPATIDPRLVTPVVERILCCLPKRFLLWSYCGVDHHSKQIQVQNKMNTDGITDEEMTLNKMNSDIEINI